MSRSGLTGVMKIPRRGNGRRATGAVTPQCARLSLWVNNEVAAALIERCSSVADGVSRIPRRTAGSLARVQGLR